MARGPILRGALPGRLVEVGLGFLGLCLRLLPRPVLLWVGRKLGHLAYRLLPGRRAVARANLEQAFARERAPEAVETLCHLSFEHLGITLLEILTFLCPGPRFPLSRITVEGKEYLVAAMGQGKGVLLLTAHFGNWELLGAAHVLSGYPLSVVMRPLDSAVLNWVVTRFRERSGFEIIGKRRALPEILQALRRGRMVGFLLDQNTTREEGIFVPFFGRLASTSKGLALVALRTGAPVVPIFIRRDRDGGHRVEIAPPVAAPDTGDREKDMLAYTQAFTSCVEEAIRRSPEQWFWVHRRWKTRPADREAE